MSSLHPDLEGRFFNPWNRDQEGNISKYNRLFKKKYIYMKN